MITPEERAFLISYYWENLDLKKGPSTKKLVDLGVYPIDLIPFWEVFKKEGLSLSPDGIDDPEIPWKFPLDLAQRLADLKLDRELSARGVSR